MPFFRKVKWLGAVGGMGYLGFLGFEKYSEHEKNQRIAQLTGQEFAKVNGANLPTSPIQGHYDVCIVGAGIIGLATAREIVNRFPKKTVVVLEKEPQVACHQTNHNSGVIHAGIYYEPGSEAAKNCVSGAKKLYEYCKKKNIPHERIGKLICATNEDEHQTLQDLLARGTKNGVQGLKILNGEEVKKMEPNVQVHSALWSPNTGIVDYAVVARNYMEDFLATKRGQVKTNFLVESVQNDSSGITVIGREPGQSGPYKSIAADHLITCAGLHADKVAQLAGGDSNHKIVTFRGSYLQLRPEYRNIVKCNIYPVPTNSGIPVGIHFTPTVNQDRGSQMIIGPGSCLAFKKEGYNFFDVNIRDLWNVATNKHFWDFLMNNQSLVWDQILQDFNKQMFIEEARKLVPSLKEEMTEPSFNGVMAQVFDARNEFIFERRALNGRALHVRNAPSPACTASLAIAERVVDIAAADFGWNATPAK